MGPGELLAPVDRHDEEHVSRVARCGWPGDILSRDVGVFSDLYLRWWQQTVVADGYRDATRGLRVVVGDLEFRGPEAAALCDEEEIY